MKFHIDNAAGQNLFTGYGQGYVSINNQRYEHPVLVLPEQVVEPWAVGGFDALTRDHFDALLSQRPEIVLFGSGDTLRFPQPELTRGLAAAAVGFEVMDTRAACRTYNILVVEGRRVVAAMLV
jgi:uncharacterized protein